MRHHGRRIQRCVSGCSLSALILLVMVGFVGCKTGDGISDEKGSALSLKEVELRGFDSRTLPAGEYVFGEESAWRKFWQERQSGAVPNIDFGRFTLAIVALGQRPNPGYSVEIIDATEYTSEVVLSVIEHFPSPGMMYAQVIVYPYDAALIPVTGKHISIKPSTGTGDSDRIRQKRPAPHTEGGP